MTPKLRTGSPAQHESGSRIFEYLTGTDLSSLKAGGYRQVEESMNIVSRYIKAFGSLHQDAIPGRWRPDTNGAAPHKPLLLISVFDEFIENPRKANMIEPTLQLEARFDSYWEKVMKLCQDTTMALPFFHLRSDGFWHLVARPGKEAILSAPVQVNRSTTALRELVRGARLDDKLYGLLCDSSWSHHLRSVLITTHFAAELHHCFFN